MTPKISIIIPVYNTLKQYLDACVSSLTAQTMKDIEIILVDDGSSQECGARCDAYAKSDDRILAVHQENQGVSVARNQGIQKAAGEWIIFVDADDWIEPDTCEKLTKYLDSYQGDMLMFNAVNEQGENRSLVHFDLEHERFYDMSDVKTREWIYRKTMRPRSVTGNRNSPMFYCWDKVYKREFLLNNQLTFTAGLPKSEDKVFILNCIEKMDSLYYVNDAFYHYRINQESVCSRFSQNADQDRVKLAEILYGIARRMDAELAVLTGNSEYNLVSGDYYRFIFGIISDVLLLNYYHEDNPESKKERNRGAKAFVKSEPFWTAIKMCSYSELSTEARLKKFMLGRGMVWEFIAALKLYRKLKGVSMRGEAIRS